MHLVDVDLIARIFSWWFPSIMVVFVDNILVSALIETSGYIYLISDCEIDLSI